MREIRHEEITSAVAGLCVQANRELGEDVFRALEDGLKIEESPAGKGVLQELIENASIARTENVPICQDTGLTVVFLEVGQEVHIVGDLEDAVQKGVARGYAEGFLRKSIVAHPLDRVNTGDNTPAVIYTDIVPGDRLKIIVAPKGGGSENMSGVGMLKPSDGVEGVKRLVVEMVRAAGPNPCPPVILGIGIGGTMDKAALLARKALLRPVGRRSSKPVDAALEEDLLRSVNDTGIGPAGLGGRVTALAVHVESFPCHIASLPVAVNIQCHAARHREILL